MGGYGFLLVTGEDMHAGFSRQEIARGAITMQLGRQTSQHHYECSQCGRMCHPTAISAQLKTRQPVLLLLCIVETFPSLNIPIPIKSLNKHSFASDWMSHV